MRTTGTSARRYNGFESKFILFSHTKRRIDTQINKYRERGEFREITYPERPRRYGLFTQSIIVEMRSLLLV